MKAKLLTSLALLGFMACAGLYAQVTTTTIYGTVTDSTGAVVPNAQVVATNLDTNLSRPATSDSEGRYQIEFLPIGSYKVEISAAGFKKFVRSGIVLQINERARVDAQLDIGSTGETVTVT